MSQSGSTTMAIRCKPFWVVVFVLVRFSSARYVAAEDDMVMNPSAAPMIKDDNQGMLDQIAQIRGHIARLQAAIQQFPKNRAPSEMSAIGDPSTDKMPTTLLGFPGEAHLYHRGATHFFLNYAEKIKLTTEQQAALTGIQERSASEFVRRQLEIDQAELALGTLTASEAPDSAKIQMKINEIGNFRIEQRFGFIQSVGEAAQLLSKEQRQQLSAEVKIKEK